jgi:CDP-6-deoxy-D-xylo-4-hexulose-3-dehydrase
VQSPCQLRLFCEPRYLHLVHRPKLGEERLRLGDEIVTVPAGFPTTVNPILQHGTFGDFIDSDLSMSSCRVEAFGEPCPAKRRVVLMVFGSPFVRDAVLDL